MATPPTASISLTKSPPEPAADTILASALPPAPPPPPGPWPSPAGGDPARRSAGRRSGPIALAALAVIVVLVAGVGVWFLVRPGPDPTSGVATAPTSAPAAAAATTVTGSATSTAPQPRRPSAGTAPSADRSSTIVPSSTSTSPAPDPMGGPRIDIPCNSGYIVQVASELDQPTLESRVAALRASGTLPAGVKWTETSTSCSVFTNQANVFVLYTGPFTDWTQACPDRLTGPPDSFVKPTDPSRVGTFLACLCPAYASGHQPPEIVTVGQQGSWVGELQRVLGAGLDYDIGSINADPAAGDAGRWGTYTSQTAAAVGRFQADQGLPVTQQVDAATWSRLQSAWCRSSGE